MRQDLCGKRIRMTYNGVTRYATIVDMVRRCSLPSEPPAHPLFFKSVQNVLLGLLTYHKAFSPTLHLWMSVLSTVIGLLHRTCATLLPYTIRGSHLNRRFPIPNYFCFPKPRCLSNLHYLQVHRCWIDRIIYDQLYYPAVPLRGEEEEDWKSSLESLSHHTTFLILWPLLYTVEYQMLKPVALFILVKN